MTYPVRLQLSRKPGFNLQEHSRKASGLLAVNVARPSRFGNPFTLRQLRAAGYRLAPDQEREEVVRCFAAWLKGDSRDWIGPESERARAAMLSAIPDLGGKNLACWCPLDGRACHADVLLEIANG